MVSKTICLASSDLTLPSSTAPFTVTRSAAATVGSRPAIRTRTGTSELGRGTGAPSSGWRAQGTRPTQSSPPTRTRASGNLAFMCDSLVAGAAETAAGVTLFAKNSDRKSSECQAFLQFPEASHPPRATVRATHIEIPQVAETYRVMGHSPWWVWGFEQGVNEHGVAIGNHTVFSNEPLEQNPGLIGMDLV